jgi:hypothetical protein
MKPKNPYKQGIYKPIHPEKYMGEIATYRSGLELRFMRFCDTNPKVLQWGSENYIIPYRHPDGKMRRYFVDNFVKIQEGGKTTKYLIEVKPSRQTIPPSTKYKKKEHMIYEQIQYAVNRSKWDACIKYCAKHGFRFLLITEKDLKHV